VDCPTHSFIADNAIVHNSICSTRLVSGHGMPQLQALYEAAQVRDEEYPEVKITADGGMKKPADIDKALVFADAVKLGSMLAGTPEAPGEILRDPNTGQQMKTYRGMASKEAFEAKLQAEGVNDVTERSVNYNPEGVSASIPLKPPVQELLARIGSSIQSCLSYSGCQTIEEFKEKAEFVRITDSGVSESDTHIFQQYS
jgi:IMP dehydrogenase/GMP reductase